MIDDSRGGGEVDDFRAELSRKLARRRGRKTRGYIERRENRDGTVSSTLRYQLDGRRHRKTVIRVEPKHERQGRLIAEDELARLRWNLELGTVNGEDEQGDQAAWVEASRRYLAWLEDHREPRTVERYSEIHRHWLDSGIAPESLEETDESHAESYRDHRLEAGRAPRTVNGELDALRAFWNWCAEKPRRWVEGGRRHNPFSIPRVRDAAGGADNPVRIFTDREVEQVRAVAPAHVVEVFDFALNTGLRSGELSWLHVEDLDIDARFVLVRGRDGHRVKDQVARSVPLNDRAFEIAEALVAEKRSGFAFTAPMKGGRWKKLGDQARYYIRRGLGLSRKGKGPSLHTCRGTFCSHALRATGGDLALVQRWMGREDIETTRRYLTSVPEHERSAISKLVMP